MSRKKSVLQWTVAEAKEGRSAEPLDDLRAGAGARTGLGGSTAGALCDAAHPSVPPTRLPMRRARREPALFESRQ